MARPRRIEGEKTAYERMEDSFWDMLEEMPYHEMTGKELRSRASVSHNTFYYHFKDLDDMAQKMFDRLATPDATLAVLRTLREGMQPTEMIADLPRFQERYHRMRLLAKSSSPLLVGLLKKSVMAAWLEATGLDEEDLEPGDRVDLEFAFGGGIALLGSTAADDFEALSGFPDRAMGRGALATLQRLEKRGTTSR